MIKKDIDDIVKGLVETVGSRSVNDIISHLNIKLVKSDNIETCYMNSNGNETIFVNSNTPDELMDFTIAHELGHAILHDVEIMHFSAFDTKKTRIEREADYFAFKLLEKKIDKFYLYDVADYARLLQVNEEVIKYVVDIEY